MVVVMVMVNGHWSTHAPKLIYHSKIPFLKFRYSFFEISIRETGLSKITEFQRLTNDQPQSWYGQRPWSRPSVMSGQNRVKCMVFKCYIREAAPKATHLKASRHVGLVNMRPNAVSGVFPMNHGTR